MYAAAGVKPLRHLTRNDPKIKCEVKKKTDRTSMFPGQG